MATEDPWSLFGDGEEEDVEDVTSTRRSGGVHANNTDTSGIQPAIASGAGFKSNSAVAGASISTAAATPAPAINAAAASIAATKPKSTTSTLRADHQLLLLTVLRAFLDDHSKHALDDLITATADEIVKNTGKDVRAALNEIVVTTKLLSVTVKPRPGGAADGAPDRATDLWLRLQAAADKACDITWSWMSEHKSWPHVCWRESYVMGSVARAVSGIALDCSDEGARAAMKAVDMALVMGAPQDEINGCVEFIEHHISAAASAGAKKGGKASAPHDAVSLTIPPVLSPSSPAPAIPQPWDAKHAIPRVAAAPNTKDVAYTGFKGAEEHPALKEARKITDNIGARPLTVNEFRKRYVKACLPVVLSGATVDWPALDRWRSLEYLSTAFGHRTIPVEIGQHLSGVWEEKPMLLSDFIQSYVRSSMGWGWGGKVVVDHTVPLDTGSADASAGAVAGPATSAGGSSNMLSGVIPITSPTGAGSISKDGASNEGSSSSAAGSSSDAKISGARVHPSRIAYLAQHGLFEQIPSLTKDFDIPLYAGNEVGAVNAWFGTAGTVTRCHYDSYNNLLTQVFGYKFVRLYAPSDSKNLYPILKQQQQPSPSDSGSVGSSASKPGHGGLTGGDEPGSAASSSSTSASSATTAQGNISAVDVEEPADSAVNKAKYPLFANAKHVDCVLGPGDILLIPKGWWHYVRSITPSFSINFWF